MIDKSWKRWVVISHGAFSLIQHVWLIPYFHRLFKSKCDFASWFIYFFGIIRFQQNYVCLYINLENTGQHAWPKVQRTWSWQWWHLCSCWILGRWSTSWLESFVKSWNKMLIAHILRWCLLFLHSVWEIADEKWLCSLSVSLQTDRFPLSVGWLYFHCFFFFPSCWTANHLLWAFETLPVIWITFC